MTMTLDEVPAKLNELDLRAPLEVFEAINDAIRERDDLWSKWQTERCFREKAKAELAEAQNTIAAQPQAQRVTRDMVWSAFNLVPTTYATPERMQWMAEHINTQLAASPRQQAAEAVGTLSVRRFRGSDAMVNHDFDYYGSLPDGDYQVYTHPAAQDAEAKS